MNHGRDHVTLILIPLIQKLQRHVLIVFPDGIECRLQHRIRTQKLQGRSDRIHDLAVTVVGDVKRTHRKSSEQNGAPEPPTVRVFNSEVTGGGPVTLVVRLHTRFRTPTHADFNIGGDSVPLAILTQHASFLDNKGAHNGQQFKTLQTVLP